MKYRLFSVLFMLLAATGGLHARQTPHIHGAAKLQVAVEGNTVEVELISPLDSLVGFEHAPRNDKQRKALDAMQEKFKTPAALFLPTAAAGCIAGPAQVTAPFAKADGPAKANDGHAELEAVVVFQCKNPSSLKDLDIRLFEAFPKLHRLQVQLIGPRGQSAATLTPKQRTLSW